MRKMGLRKVNLFTVTEQKSSQVSASTWAAWLQSWLFCTIALSLKATGLLRNKDVWPELLPRNFRVQAFLETQGQRSLSEYSLASDPQRKEAWVTVMVNIICQSNWAMGCRDSWLNMIPGCVSEGVHSQRRLAFELVGPPQCGGPNPVVHWEPE